ncbi:MAG: hypothetical protein ABR501_13410 [Pyrinomonadaceae bacterium]
MNLKVSRLSAAVLAMLSIVSSSSPSTDKLTVQDLVARHLESIGKPEARASITTRIISGNSLVVFRTPPPGQATGRAVLASEGLKSLIGMSFPNPVYPREQLGFDGKSFLAAYTTPGVRSSLGSFLMTHDLVFRQGLMGGTLTTAWPLLDLTARNPRLEYVGLKTVDKRRMHELKYLARGGSDLQIALFFEEETFRHVRTQYERVIAASIGTRSSIDAKERETRYKMVEEFSDYKQEGPLTLPHSYKIKLATDTESGSFLADWQINLTQFTFNERIDPASFNIGAH